eukprot:5738088-Pleurochrysis_carterae.AAC.2
MCMPECGAGCVVLFYSAVTPPLSKVETTGPDTMPLATEPALARKASVKDERQPQPSPLTRLLSLLGRAWGSSRQSCAISDASSVSEKQRSQQHVSQGHFSSKVVRLPSAAVPQVRLLVLIHRAVEVQGHVHDLYAATKQVVVSLNSAFIAAVDAASQQQDKLSSLFHPTVMKQVKETSLALTRVCSCNVNQVRSLAAANVLFTSLHQTPSPSLRAMRHESIHYTHTHLRAYARTTHAPTHPRTHTLTCPCTQTSTHPPPTHTR